MDVKRQGQQYFDARSETYDQDDLHPRVAHLLVESAHLEPGQRVLDLATGTGLLALEAARRVGPGGSVTGLDLSAGMLAQARAKAAGLEQVTFMQGDAETLPFGDGDFDRVLCSSALVLMSDVPAALREWARVLRRGGLLAFDAPDGQVFGPRGVLAQAAAARGLHLAYAEVAATPERCRALLEQAGLDMVAVRTERVQDDLLPLGDALAVWDQCLRHPAWHDLLTVSSDFREEIRADFVARLTALAQDEQVPNRVSLHLVTGRKR